MRDLDMRFAEYRRLPLALGAVAFILAALLWLFTATLHFTAAQGGWLARGDDWKSFAVTAAMLYLGWDQYPVLVLAFVRRKGAIYEEEGRLHFASGGLKRIPAARIRRVQLERSRGRVQTARRLVLTTVSGQDFVVSMQLIKEHPEDVLARLRRRLAEVRLTSSGG